MLFPIECAACKKEFFRYPSEMQSIRGPRKYCSMQCRNDGMAKLPQSPCRWCGGKTKRRSYLFCSKPCKGAYQKALKIPRGGPMVPRKENKESKHVRDIRQSNVRHYIHVSGGS